jgi:hypothetical protein
MSDKKISRFNVVCQKEYHSLQFSLAIDKKKQKIVYFRIGLPTTLPAFAAMVQAQANGSSVALMLLFFFVAVGFEDIAFANEPEMHYGLLGGLWGLTLYAPQPYPIIRLCRNRRKS